MSARNRLGNSADNAIAFLSELVDLDQARTHHRGSSFS
jgi:hypothetical protein